MSRLDPAIKQKLFTLSKADSNEKALRKKHYEKICATTIKNLKLHGFEAYYANDTKEAGDLILDLIPDESVVGCGDSHTLFACNIDDALTNQKKCEVISHLHAFNTKGVHDPRNKDYIIGNDSQMRELLMQYLCSDVFILGANGISMDGQIVNIDGQGNRVAGGIFGPNRIIVVAGANKIERKLEDAISRARNTAAHINNLKYNATTPCVEAGFCVDCNHPDRICNITTVIHRKPENSDYHVILIGEELGF